MQAIVQDGYGTRPEAVLRLAEIARPTSGDDEMATTRQLPLVVLTVSEHPYPGLAPQENAHLKAVRGTGQAHWASVSSSA